MSHRIPQTLPALATVTLVLVFAAGLAFGQTGSTSSGNLPRTPDGKPDLQGLWVNNTTTPLERPKELGVKEFYTEQEFVEVLKRTQRAFEEEAQGGRPTEPGTVEDVHYDLSQFGLDRSHTTVAYSKRTSLIVGPDGRVPPLTPEAQKKAAERAEQARGHQFDGPENRPLTERCIVWNNGPPMLPIGYNSNLQILQTPGYVAILQEMIHTVRIIPTDGRPPLSPDVRQWLGNSRGRWEGDTLVVETTGFNDKINFRGASTNLRVVERFKRTDENTIIYQFTVEDPTTWTKPWSAEVPFAKTEGEVFEYACHEGNYGMANSLSGARADEKKAAEEAAKKGSR